MPYKQCNISQCCKKGTYIKFDVTFICSQYGKPHYTDRTPVEHCSQCHKPCLTDTVKVWVKPRGRKRINGRQIELLIFDDPAK